MWLFKLFQRDDRWTYPELEASLRVDLKAPDYQILRNEDSVAIKVREQLVAYIELKNEGREAVLFYEYSLVPYFAGRIAMALDALLPTEIAGTAFEAQRLDEIEPVEGCH